MSEYRLPMMLVGMSVIALVCAVLLFVKTVTHTEPIRFSSDGKISSQSAQLVVDISGAVKNPGVYMFADGSRVSDAIVRAGGFSDEADLDAIAIRINQASLLSDGAKLYIPKKTAGNSTVSAPSSSRNLGTLSDLVSINTASQKDLEALTGIGPVTAKKVMDNRPYSSLEELVSKHVLSASLFEKLKAQLSL